MGPAELASFYSMKLAPNIARDLGFDTVKNWLKERTHSEQTVQEIARLFPSSDINIIRHRQTLANEIAAAFDRDESTPLREFPDITSWLPSLNIVNTRLSPEQFRELYQVIVSIRELKHYLARDHFPVWHEYAVGMADLEEQENHIRRVFDDEFQVRDSASGELKQIRRSIRQTESAIHRRMQDLFSEALSNNWLNGDKIVWREGRLSLPMRASHKRKIKGIVHSESGTGQTSFVEPLEIIERNNDLAELQFVERAEIQRILQELTAEFHPHYECLEESLAVMVRFDMHAAFARFSEVTSGTRPEFTSDGSISVELGRNPILELSGKKVVPLNLKLNRSTRVMLLSGPNAGGKTVTLKTVGLFAILAQCGLNLPAWKTNLPVFTRIVTDIGDQQSIENDLSTFSANIKNIKYILKVADEHTLILMDELGTGTDPDAGTAISRALLEKLIQRRSQVVATSHLGALKMWAHDTKGIINGGMIFDPDRLAPTYELSIGHPGGSFAIEISKRIGLQPAIIERAEELFGDSSVKLEILLNDLEARQAKIRKMENDIGNRARKLKTREDRINELETEVKRHHRNARSEALKESREIIANARREAENLVQHIRKKDAGSEAIRKTRTTIEKRLKNIDRKLRYSDDVPGGALKAEEAAKGLQVKIPHLDESGVIVLPPDNQQRVTVEVNGIRIKLKVNQLVRDVSEEKPSGTVTAGTNEVSQPESYRIDLRGMRVEEAVNYLEKYLDGALIAGLKEVEILHGKGTGALMDAVRSYLKRQPFVKSYDFAHPDFGGAGITIAELG